MNKKNTFLAISFFLFILPLLFGTSIYLFASKAIQVFTSVDTLKKEQYFPIINQVRIFFILYVIFYLACVIFLFSFLSKRKHVSLSPSSGEKEEKEIRKDTIPTTKQLEFKDRAIKSNIMDNLIKGRHLSDYCDMYALELPVSLEFQHNILLAFDIENSDTKELSESILYATENVITALLKDSFSIFIAEAEGIMLCLINNKEKEVTKELDLLKQKAEQVVSFMKEKLEIPLFVLLSDIHDKITGIQICYQEIQEIAKYRRENNLSQVIFCYNEWNEKPLIESFPNSDDEEEISELVEEVKHYIEENFKDKDLTVGGIADTYHVSLSYLSQMFKRQTKVGILEYIHIQRVEEAKRLLRKGVLVQSVADEVGYYNTRPLIRMFKKIEHMTPGEYRDKR